MNTPTIHTLAALTVVLTIKFFVIAIASFGCTRMMEKGTRIANLFSTFPSLCLMGFVMAHYYELVPIIGRNVMNSGLVISLLLSIWSVNKAVRLHWPRSRANPAAIFFIVPNSHLCYNSYRMNIYIYLLESAIITTILASIFIYLCKNCLLTYIVALIMAIVFILNGENAQNSIIIHYGMHQYHIIFFSVIASIIISLAYLLYYCTEHNHD